MSNRRKALQAPDSNPATKFLSWKSNEKCFSYFDKEIASTLTDPEEIKQKANVQVKLPFRFLVLENLASVKGWSDSLGGNIVSNEVKFISKEPLTVKAYHKNGKGEKVSTEIAKGIYKEIKEKVNTAGAKYHASIYIMLEDGSLANIQLKGAAVQKWGEFKSKGVNRLADEWVIVEKSAPGKKGAVTYNTPEFRFERSISDSEAEQADAAFDMLEAYLKTYLAKSEPEHSETLGSPHENEDPVDDDLDF